MTLYEIFGYDALITKALSNTAEAERTAMRDAGKRNSTADAKQMLAVTNEGNIIRTGHWDDENWVEMMRPRAEQAALDNKIRKAQQVLSNKQLRRQQLEYLVAQIKAAQGREQEIASDDLVAQINKALLGRNKK